MPTSVPKVTVAAPWKLFPIANNAARCIRQETAVHSVRATEQVRAAWRLHSLLLVYILALTCSLMNYLSTLYYSPTHWPAVCLYLLSVCLCLCRFPVWFLLQWNWCDSSSWPLWAVLPCTRTAGCSTRWESRPALLTLHTPEQADSDSDTCHPFTPIQLSLTLLSSLLWWWCLYGNHFICQLGWTPSFSTFRYVSLCGEGL